MNSRLSAKWITGPLMTACLLAASAFGQSTTGSISGTVKDSSGAPIPGATVTVTNPENSVSQQAMTEEDGVFVAPQLPPGTYTISVEKAGFKKLEKKEVILSAADRLSAGTFVLEVGAVTETVSIVADAGQLSVQSESGERSDLITGEQINNLALNGRDLLDLMKIIPGVVSDNFNGQISGPGGLADFNINGTRGNQHELTVDGASNVDTGSNGTRHVTINPDAVSQVKVLTSNYQAEFGKAGGGLIQFVTKSGTKQFHGGARFFHRHEGFNANNYFNNAQVVNGQSIPRPLYRYNSFGYDIGGPVWIPGVFNQKKDKLFFFLSQEFYRQFAPTGDRKIRVPTVAERSGDFSQTTDGNGNKIYIRDPLKTGTCSATNQAACFPGNIIPRDRWFKDGQAILNLYPLPNVPDNPQYNFISQSSSQYPRRELILRLDYNLTEKTRLSFRGVTNNDKQLLPYGTFSSGLNFPLSRIVFPQPGVNVSLTLSHTFSPTLLNEFIFGPSRNRLTLDAEDEKATLHGNKLSFQPLFPGANVGDYIPNFRFGGIGGINDSNSSNFPQFPSTGFNGLPFRNVNWTFNVIDNLTKLWGLHTVKAGVFVQRSLKNQTSFGPNNATIEFNSNSSNPLNTNHPFSNALLGIYNLYTQADKLLTGYYRYTNAEGYVQDTWRVRPRLTLNYGLRLAWYQPQYDTKLQTGVFNPDLFDRSKAVRLYETICVGASPCASGASRRAVDPANRPAVPTMANTLPDVFIGVIVPGSGDIANGIGRADKGYPQGGFDNRGIQWAPRLDFAYDLFGDGKTVVRGGGGIFYDRVQGNLAFDMIATPPGILTPRLFYGYLQNLEGVGNNVFAAPSSVVGFAKDGKLPTVYSYSLNLQRDVGFKTVVDLAYVGTLSRHLSRNRNLNAIPYGVTFTKAAQDPTRYAGSVVPEVQPNLPDVYLQAGLNFAGDLAKRVDFLRPYPGYGDINYREFAGTANYNSLQLKVNRRFTRGFTFGIAYTWSKAMDTSNSDTESVNPFDTRRYEYRLASFDRTHNFTANYVYNLPKLSRYLKDNQVAKVVFDDWQVSGITRFISGSPFELATGISGLGSRERISGSYTDGARFYLRSNPQRSPYGLQIDPNAFVIPPIGDLGPWPRNYLRGPGVNNHDLTIFKNLPWGREGKRSLQLRFEMFNAFNHTQFKGINSNVNLAVPVQNLGDPIPSPIPAGVTFRTGSNIFSDYGRVIITNNLRPADSNKPLGQYFGEYNSARDPRIIQLGVKLYF